MPIGYIWHREIGLGFDPDLRDPGGDPPDLRRFRELGSARQVFRSMLAEQVHFPRPSDGKKLVSFAWTPIRYRNVISVLKNPFYAGAYAYGKGEKRTEIVDGRARKSYGHRKALEEWEVLLKDHHDGYIDWAEFERNQKQLAVNAYGKLGGEVGARRTRAAGWAAILWALWAPLVVSYSGRPGQPVYRCDRPNQMLGLPRCFTFGGLRVDAAIAQSCSARSSRWRSRRQWRPDAGTWKLAVNNSASSNSSCNRPGMKPRWRSGTLPAIPTIVSSPPSSRRAGRRRFVASRRARRD